MNTNFNRPKQWYDYDGLTTHIVYEDGSLNVVSTQWFNEHFEELIVLDRLSLKSRLQSMSGYYEYPVRLCRWEESLHEHNKYVQLYYEDGTCFDISKEEFEKYWPKIFVLDKQSCIKKFMIKERKITNDEETDEILL